MCDAHALYEAMTQESKAMLHIKFTGPFFGSDQRNTVTLQPGANVQACDFGLVINGTLYPWTSIGLINGWGTWEVEQAGVPAVASAPVAEQAPLSSLTPPAVQKFNGQSKGQRR